MFLESQSKHLKGFGRALTFLWKDTDFKNFVVLMNDILLQNRNIKEIQKP